MAGHTPGPWIADVEAEVVGAVGGGVVVYETNKNPADMYLIAAAPDLLLALEFVSRARGAGELCWCDSQPVLTTHSTGCLMARAAIAKTEGRSMAEDRVTRRWWVVDDGRLCETEGWSCEDSGYWWFPSLGAGASEGVHVFATREAAVAAAKAELRKLAVEIEHKLNELA